MASFSLVYVSIPSDFNILCNSQLFEASASCLTVNSFVNLFLGHRSIMCLQNSAKVSLEDLCTVLRIEYGGNVR